MSKCNFCIPHADPRKQRLCHVGVELFHAYKEAGEEYSRLSNTPDPPPVATERAREAMADARAKYRAHTDGA